MDPTGKRTENSPANNKKSMETKLSKNDGTRAPAKRSTNMNTKPTLGASVSTATASSTSTPSTATTISAASMKLSTTRMSKEQRERKRLINRLSAQRKRKRDRNQLDTFTDQQEVYTYLNDSLQLDNLRLEQLKKQLQEIVAGSAKQNNSRGNNGDNGDNDDGNTSNNVNDDAGSSLANMFVKMDTLERLQTCLQTTIREPLPSRITDFTESHQDQAPLSDNPYAQTSEYLQERLLVLEKSKELMMDPSKATKEDDDHSTSRNDEERASGGATSKDPQQGAYHSENTRTNPLTTDASLTGAASMVLPAPTANPATLPQQAHATASHHHPLGHLTKDHILRIFASLDTTSLQHILHLANCHGLTMMGGSAAAAGVSAIPSPYAAPLTAAAMYPPGAASTAFLFPHHHAAGMLPSYPAAAFPPGPSPAAPGANNPTTTTATQQQQQQQQQPSATTNAPQQQQQQQPATTGQQQPMGMPPLLPTAALGHPHPHSLDPTMLSLLSQQYSTVGGMPHHLQGTLAVPAENTGAAPSGAPPGN